VNNFIWTIISETNDLRIFGQDCQPCELQERELLNVLGCGIGNFFIYYYVFNAG